MELQKNNFDYSKYGITDEKELEYFYEKEEKIINLGNQIIKTTLEMGKELSELQEKLTNYGNGSFTDWYERLGLKKDFVYREINRWRIFEKYKIPKIADASVRTLEFVKQNEDKISEEVIEEILETPTQASKKIKEIKNEIETQKMLERPITVDMQLKILDAKIDRHFDKIDKLEEQKKKLLEQKNKGKNSENLEYKNYSEYDELDDDDLEAIKNVKKFEN